MAITSLHIKMRTYLVDCGWRRLRSTDTPHKLRLGRVMACRPQPVKLYHSHQKVLVPEERSFFPRKVHLPEPRDHLLCVYHYTAVPRQDLVVGNIPTPFVQPVLKALTRELESFVVLLELCNPSHVGFRYNGESCHTSCICPVVPVDPDGFLGTKSVGAQSGKERNLEKSVTYFLYLIENQVHRHHDVFMRNAASSSIQHCEAIYHCYLIWT